MLKRTRDKRLNTLMQHARAIVAIAQECDLVHEARVFASCVDAYAQRRDTRSMIELIANASALFAALAHQYAYIAADEAYYALTKREE